MRAKLAFSVSALLLCGCASTQLNMNTLNIAGSVDDVYTRQTLANLSRTIDNPSAIPSQVDLAAGTIQTSNSVTPSIGFPLSSSITRNGLNLLTQSVHAGETMSVNASDGWQQSWTIAPITDGDFLRNLRALYRHVVVADSDLTTEYRPASVLKNGKYVVDPYALREPHCVLCGLHLVPNPKLRSGWLYWTSDSSGVPARLPPPGTPTVSLGHYSGHELLMTRRDYYAGYLEDFTLFVMGTGGPSESAGSGGGAGGKSGGSGKHFNLFVPQQINPQIQ